MDIKFKRVVEISFSPCFSTEKTALTLARTLADELKLELVKIPFTVPSERSEVKTFASDDIVIIASPTYAGKLPNKILPDFTEKIKGNGGPAIAMVTFGNRAFDNSLAELSSVLSQNGFALIAGAALVNEHTMAHVASRRPDQDDIEEIKSFAKKTADKLLSQDLSCPVIPGDASAAYYIPKQENGMPAKFLKAKPLIDPEKCTNCGTCAKVCPMGSIDPNDFSNITGTCIKCHACINRCTKSAKFFDDEQLLSHIRMLQENYNKRSKNEYFLF